MDKFKSNNITLNNTSIPNCNIFIQLTLFQYLYLQSV